MTAGDGGVRRSIRLVRDWKIGGGCDRRCIRRIGCRGLVVLHIVIEGGILHGCGLLLLLLASQDPLVELRS